MVVETLIREQTIHLKKFRAGELGGIARARNLTPEQLSAIGKMGGRPRNKTIEELMLAQSQVKRKTIRRKPRYFSAFSFRRETPSEPNGTVTALLQGKNEGKEEKLRK